jgi:hypothetical protein
MNQENIVFMIVLIASGLIGLTFFIFLGHLIFNDFFKTKTKTNSLTQRRLVPIIIPRPAIPRKSNT